jgi:hypothetical protein
MQCPDCLRKSSSDHAEINSAPVWYLINSEVVVADILYHAIVYEIVIAELHSCSVWIGGGPAASGVARARATSSLAWDMRHANHLRPGGAPSSAMGEEAGRQGAVRQRRHPPIQRARYRAPHYTCHTPEMHRATGYQQS